MKGLWFAMLHLCMHHALNTGQGAPILLTNQRNQLNWLKLRLEPSLKQATGTPKAKAKISSRDAVGARVSLYTGNPA